MLALIALLRVGICNYHLDLPVNRLTVALHLYAYGIYFLNKEQRKDDGMGLSNSLIQVLTYACVCSIELNQGWQLRQET